MRSPARPQHLRRSVALCIAAFQEDPDYLRKCLRSIRRISFPGLKVVLVVDGNRPEDRYMMDIFQEVMGGADQAGSLGVEGQLPQRRERRGRRQRRGEEHRAHGGGGTSRSAGQRLSVLLRHAGVGGGNER